MKNRTKVWLIIASALIFVGCIIFGSVMTMLKWDFRKLSTVRYEEKEYIIDEAYKNISIVTNTADILFVPSENSKTLVVCNEQKNMKHSVAVKDSVLTIDIVDTRKWFEFIGIDFGTAKITVYIPKGDYGELSVRNDTGNVEIPKAFTFESIDILSSTGAVSNYASASRLIKIKTSTGSIGAENISAEALDLSVSTGKIVVSNVTCLNNVKIDVSTGKTNLTNIHCENLLSKGNTGDIFLNSVIATEKIAVERGTGDVRFDASDGAEILVETDTGDVTGSLLTDKVFITQSDTGSINVPKTVMGGRCEISTDTGDIKLTVVQ